MVEKIATSEIYLMSMITSNDWQTTVHKNGLRINGEIVLKRDFMKYGMSSPSTWKKNIHINPNLGSGEEISMEKNG